MSELKKYLPVPTKKKRYYTQTQISLHNQANNCWVTLFGQVFDLTTLLQKHIHMSQTRPLISSAGTDITYLFDSKSREPRTRIDLSSGDKTFYSPGGQYLHLQSTDTEIKWWKDQSLVIGRLTQKSRRVRLINMLTDHETVLEVPCEETIQEILDRYLEFNAHAGSYIWKRLGRPMDMTKTLGENGVKDEDAEFQRLGIPESDWYIPAIHLFFNDDLTVA